MKKIFYLAALVAVIAVAGCTGKKTGKNITISEDSTKTAVVPDTTIYGTCGEATAMHTLQLITDAGDSLQFDIADEGPDSASVLGGLLVGDRMAVIAHDVDGAKYATRIINLTTLVGKWTSIDKNFEILEGGVVKNNVKAESNPWTAWKIYNGNLLLNTDTFQINTLGADSLYLENNVGIFLYKRQK
jgi:hypothetical protein